MGQRASSSASGVHPQVLEAERRRLAESNQRLIRANAVLGAEVNRRRDDLGQLLQTAAVGGGVALLCVAALGTVGAMRFRKHGAANALLRSELARVQRTAKLDVAAAQQFGLRSAARGLIEVADNLQRALEVASSSALPAIPPTMVSSTVSPAAPHEAPHEAPQQHASASSDAAFHEGVGMTHRQLLHCLAEHGVEPINPAPASGFEAGPHEAVGLAPTDEGGAPNTVAQLLQPGWALHDRVLRPARVVVYPSK